MDFLTSAIATIIMTIAYIECEYDKSTMRAFLLKRLSLKTMNAITVGAGALAIGFGLYLTIEYILPLMANLIVKLIVFAAIISLVIYVALRLQKRNEESDDDNEEEK